MKQSFHFGNKSFAYVNTVIHSFMLKIKGKAHLLVLNLSWAGPDWAGPGQAWLVRYEYPKSILIVILYSLCAEALIDTLLL